MFSKFKHKCDDIKLFANFMERHALATVLKEKTNISNAEVFIDELQAAILDQASKIGTINKMLRYRLFHREDYCIFVCQHLSTMRQDDFDKVLRHLRALFIDRSQYFGMFDDLGHRLSIPERIYIFNGIIVPWLHWVRSAKKNKSDTAKGNTNTTTNKTSDDNNVMCNQCACRCCRCSCRCGYTPARSCTTFQQWLRDSGPFD